MLLYHGIHGLDVQEHSIYDYGELAIGIGTFILAVAVAVSTYYNSRKDRKVHIANKRHEWINEVRNLVSEITSEILNIYNPDVDLSLIHISEPTRPY